MTVLAKEIEATYEVLAKMGEGGMGAVYKVRHRFFDEVRVIKVMQAELQAVDELKERFLGEAKRGKQLRHPNLAEVLDFSITEDGTAYIVMEYIAGINLRQLLQRKRGPLDFRTVIPIAQQALQALGFLHSKKFVHRDISPDNLMLTRDGDVERVKLIDLGIAKSLESTRHLTMAGKFLGKLQYASPEQFGGQVDARSDIYSFGLVLYELLTNERPITGENSFSIISGHVNRLPRPFEETDPGGLVPSPVREAVLKALQKRPEDRFQSTAELAEALSAALGPRQERTLVEERLVTQPRPIPETIEVTQPVTAAVADQTVVNSVVPARSRRSYAVVVVAALLLFAGAAVLLWMRPSPQPPPKRVVSAPDTVASTTLTVEAPVLASGQLLVNALPWGFVTSVRDDGGTERLLETPAETPLLLALPSGHYKVRLTNPYSDRSVVLDATVIAYELSRIETDLDRIDVASYIDAVGAGN